MQAIEDSDLEKLPPVAFVKGYIRTYAKLVGLSEEKIISEFEQEVPHEQESELQPRSGLPGEADSQTPVIKLISGLIVVFAILVLIFAVYSYYTERSERLEQARLSEPDDSQSQPLSEVIDADLPVSGTQPAASEFEFSETDAIESAVSELDTAGTAPDAGPGETATGEFYEAETVPDSEAAAEAEIEAEAAPVDFPAQDSAADAEAENIAEVASELVDEKIMPIPTVAPITGGDVLAVSADEECWAEIVDANDIRLFYGMIKPGRDLSLTGQAPFDIFLGNAPVVRLSLNATEIDMTKYTRSNNIAQFKVSVEDGRARFH